VKIEMQRGAQLGKRSSNPIQKVVNPVGTVITVSVPSEEATATLTSPSECESSVEEESEVKPLHGCSRKDPPPLDDTVRWPAVSKSTCYSQCKRYEPSECENKEAELRMQEKGKENTQSVSSERYSNKVQDERKDNKCPEEEDNKECNVTVRETEHKDITVPWRNRALQNGPLDLTAGVWDKRRAEGTEPQIQSQKSLSGVEDVNSESNKEAEVKMVKSKVQISLKVKDRNDANCKPKSFLAKGMYVDNPSGQGSLKRGKSSRSEEDMFCERTFNLDEVKFSETKCSKQNTKKKASGITSGPVESKKLSTGDKHHMCLDGERRDGIVSVPKVRLVDPVSTSDALSTEDDKQREPKLVDFDDPYPSGAHGVIKKTNMKHKDSQSLLLEDNEFIAIPDSGDTTNSEKLGSLLVSLPKIEPLKLCSSLLREYHFGTGRNAVRNSNFESLSRKSEPETESSEAVQSITEEISRFQTRDGREKTSCKGSAELETGSDRSRQKNPMFKSALDDVFVSPVQSWSSIVSSSNTNKSPVRDIVVPTSSETVLLNLEEMRMSPQRSWSEVAKGLPDHAQIGQTSVTDICGGFETVKGPEDLDDYSDEGEDKMAVESRKSQSSDHTYKMVMSSKSLRTAAVSGIRASAAGNEEDCSQLNDENTGNDDEVADNGEATSIISLQGANKKSRRMKKKRR
jgi:hypothetical protein